MNYLWILGVLVQRQGEGVMQLFPFAIIFIWSFRSILFEIIFFISLDKFLWMEERFGVSLSWSVLHLMLWLRFVQCVWKLLLDLFDLGEQNIDGGGYWCKGFVIGGIEKFNIVARTSLAGNFTQRSQFFHRLEEDWWFGHLESKTWPVFHFWKVWDWFLIRRGWTLSFFERPYCVELLEKVGRCLTHKMIS
jgi:hypothetical protein